MLQHKVSEGQPGNQECSQFLSAPTEKGLAEFLSITEAFSYKVFSLKDTMLRAIVAFP